jgi:DNA ligase (NAD+)
VDDVGEVIAESIVEYFQDEINKEVINRLKAAGLKFEVEESQKAVSEILKGKIIVISGNFSISRDEMKALIVAHGGKNSGSISGKTTYLLAGEKPGPEKIKKAEALGVEIIDEARFRTIIGEAAAESQEETEPTLF